MQVTETLSEGLKRGYTFTLPGKTLTETVDRKLAEAQPEVEMKGFRKGKVPMAMLRKQYGQRLMGDALQEAIDTALRGHLEETGHRPALQPTIEMANGEDWKEGDDVVVNVAYEALPDIPETDLSDLELERLVVEIEDGTLDEALQNLARNARSFEDRPEGTPAETDDQVVIDFKGMIGDEAFEGGSAEDYPLVLGSGSFIPGFEEQLTGAKAGEERDVTVRFPEDYGAPNLAGKEAVFKTRVKAVRAGKPAEIDDELAKRYGAADLADLKAQITDRLGADYRGAARQVMKRTLLDRLDERVKFELPPSLVEAEAHQIAHQLWHDEHPEEHGHGHGHIEPTEEHMKLAERRVRLGLLLAEIGQKAGVNVSDQEMTQAVMAQARNFPGQERAFFEYIQNTPAAAQQLRAPIFEEKVVDHIVAGAKVTDRKVTKEELEKAIEALDQA